jgi:Tol biopolymer transport system component
MTARDTLNVVICPLTLLFVVPGAAAENPADSPALATNTRQLTFEGNRAGEGYFSRDGSLMVFQSERDLANPFYQIYLMDLETGDTERISPGHGKTTCSWIHPDNRHVTFASTHADPATLDLQKAELELRASGNQRRYAWDYDEHFDLYTADRRTGKIKRLTTERGYDAEACVSPDGKRIVFSSNRLAYSQPLSEADGKKFELDKSFMLDLYMMDADGSNVRRLTDVRGYDGGPFFSCDGAMICWRRFSEDGATAEIFVMNADGTNERQLTRLGAMSWAPFFHPSGKYLIFTTNLQGFANFELYIVSIDGGEPMRVTNLDGFDGLPVFSPDGIHLAWTANRTPNKQGQIFIGDWDHERALQRLSEADKQSDATAMVENPVRTGAHVRDTKTVPAISADDLRQYVETLASDEFDGRLTGAKGEQLATQYVADAFKRIDLEPGGDNGGYFQPFDFTAGMEVEPSSRLTARVAGGSDLPTPELNKDWRPLTWSHTGQTNPADVVWAGYGILAPAGEGFDEYDSFVHLDVSGKWVMVLRFMPEDITPEHRQHFSRFTSLRYKAMTLRDKGAAGMIIVSGPNSDVKEQLVPVRFDASAGEGSLPVVSMTNELAQALLTAGGKDNLKETQTALDDGSPQMGFALKDVQVSANIALKRERKTGRNVLAWLRGANTGDRSAVVVGAHVDHLGHGAGGNSLARENEKGRIHHGADDNASGTAAMLEVAEYLADQQRSSKLNLKRDILFVAWSGEELGLLGSAHFVEQAAGEIGNSTDISTRYAAYLNMDMVGRYSDKVVIQGVGSSSIWAGEIERRNAPVGLKISVSEDSYLPTDATSFFLKGVPILSAFTGSHEDYHSPRDTADKINYDGARDIAKFIALVTRSLALSDQAPDYKKPEKPKSHESRAGLRTYLGTIPDYGETEVPGLKLSGVAKGGPAATSGLRGGDVIVELAGRKVENIHDYTFAMDALKIGQETTITVVRAGERHEFKITPGSRE